MTQQNAEVRRELLEKIKDEVIDLKDSALQKERIKNKVHPVIGEGSHYAEIMIIGEAPGKNEAIQGRPFVGASGKFLDKMLESIGIKREDVYITNIVKDRPPENRDPTPPEIEQYGPFLDRQIDIIQPKVIATLGRFSMIYIMKRLGLDAAIEPISKAHGKAYEAQASYGTVQIFPLYHPAAALYNGSLRETLKKDFEILKQYADKK
ncbi:MAG: uracil-DNA glycosylase [bacterium]|nr:uracil-DNA glycosylase [bacterium]